MIKLKRIGKASKNDNITKFSQSPGPATYLVDNFPGKSSAKSFKFGSDDKFREKRSTTPGPGSYNQLGLFGREGKNIAFGNSSKTLNKNNSGDLPGPGQYDPKLVHKPNVKSLKIVNPSNSASNIVNSSLPGPGNYSPERKFLSSYKNIPKWTMGNRASSSSLHSRIEKYHATLPAPGTYEVHMNIGEGPKVKLNLV